MKRIAAGILTLILMAVLVGLAVRRPANDAPQSSATTPESQPFEGAEACVTQLLERARVGDVPAYLDAFAGPIRERIERDATAQGQEAFAAELRRAAASRRSHAVFGPEPDGPDGASVDVEFVYKDHNERQTYRLERGTSGWRVTEVATLRSSIPASKTGALADYREPEGVPVPLPTNPATIAPSSPESPREE